MLKSHENCDTPEELRRVREKRVTDAVQFKVPDMVTAACEKILELTLSKPLPPPNENGNIRVFMTNTRGSDSFLSKEQFDRFYWPTFKILVNTLIERGGTPYIFFEGNFTSRLEYLLEFPKWKGRRVYFSAKEFYR